MVPCHLRNIVHLYTKGSIASTKIYKSIIKCNRPKIFKNCYLMSNGNKGHNSSHQSNNKTNHNIESRVTIYEHMQT